MDPVAPPPPLFDPVDLGAAEADARPPASPPPASAPPASPSSKARLRMIRVAVFAIVGAVGLFFILPNASRKQHVRLHLGSGSSRIVHATARVGRSGAWDREITWNFERGAPPAIPWSFELPNGHAEVEVELASATSSVDWRVAVDLGGDDVSVELADALRGLE